MIRFLILMMAILFVSCRINYQNIIGTYELKNFPKTTLVLNEDSSFIFTQNNPNPYLHPFPHLDNYYFKTTGIWDAVPGIIRLKGPGKLLKYKTVNIQKIKPSSNKRSNIRFVDEFGDTVPILFVQNTDGTTTFAFHRSMQDFDADFSKRDTLQFHFFGYAPWTLINGEKINRNYLIKLLPAFKPNGIDSLYLKLRRSVIGSKKLKFIKKKSK